MRRTHLIAALPLLALGLATALWLSVKGTTEDAGARPASALAAEREQGAPVVRDSRVPSAEPARVSAVSETGEAEPRPLEAREQEPALPTCTLLGRVVDEEGRPLHDVLVRASAFRTWREGLDVPRLEDRGDLRGFEARSDASGAFRIEAPVPTAEVVAVRVLPDRFHDSWVTRLGRTSSCDGPPLAEGPRDLGEIRLARAGAIRGRITDELGAPLEGVELSTGPNPSSTYQRGGRTEPDGTYLIPHALVGTYGVSTKLEGFLSQFQSPVTVEAGRDTAGIDFVLRPAPSIEGVVVDETGQPVEGARLWGWPTSSGSGAGARSGADGRFVVYLPQDEPYRFSVERDGYATWDEEGGHDVILEPGARDVRIALQSIPRTRFLVVDARTGERIERFGLGILENNGSRARRRSFTEKRPPPQADHPGGVVEATARPGVDLYIVAAQGYLPEYGDVEHAAQDDPSQTIRLRRSGVVRGRIMRDGAPVASAAVTLFGTNRSGRRGPDGEMSYTVRVDRNQRSTTESDAEGRFSLDAPAPAGNRLVVEPRSGAPLVLDGITVDVGTEVDLGQLELLPGASVEGQVLLPAGVETAGLTVFLGDRQDAVKTITDAQGRFRFEQLAAGEGSVMLQVRPGLLAGGARADFELRAGEVTQVRIDAREHGICEVTLRLDLGGLPGTGIQVDLVRTAYPPERQTLGKSDEEGRVHGFVRGWGEARAVLHLPGHRTLRGWGAPLVLEAGGHVDEVLHFELATLRVILPQGAALPEEGTLRLVLEPDGTSQEPETIRVPIARGAPRDPGDLVAAVEGGVEIRAVPAGSWRVRVEFEDSETPLSRVPMGSGYRLERAPYFSGSAAVTLRAGETASLRL